MAVIPNPPPEETGGATRLVDLLDVSADEITNGQGILWDDVLKLFVAATIEGTGGGINTILFGSIDPTASTGTDGDFFINTTAPKTFFGPKASGAWPPGEVIKGDTGAAGADGAPGADGATGPQGPQGEQGIQGPAGADGAQGPAGSDGTDGTDGKTILSGTVAPTTEGTDGDYYLNTTTSTLFGPKATTWPTGVSLIGPAGAQGEQGIQGTAGVDGADGAQGPAGSDGAPGADGKTVLNGTVDPTTEGALGDFYINTTSSEIFGPKSAGGWGTGVSLVGPQGDTGAAGADGATGATGAAGADGSPGADGDDGADGKTVLSGAGAPSGALGVDGDWYIDTTAHAIYGPKTSGAWGASTSLIGPQGPAGADGTGTTATQVTPTAIAIAHATTDAAAGKTASIDLTANHGMVTRLRFYADFIAGQQVAWSGLVNQANGYDHDDTSIAFDGALGTLTAGDYVKWGEEICLVGGSGTISTPATLTRGQKGTTATYHPDNEQMVKLNDGIRLEFYPNSNYLPAERVFAWNGIMTGAWTTSAAISSGAQVLYTTADPTVVSDFGFDDLIVIDPAGTPEIARVAAVFGDVANNSFDKSIFVQGTLAAHDNTKPVYRVAEFDVPIPFKFTGTATTLYIKMFVDEKITGTVTGTLEVVGDKWS